MNVDKSMWKRAEELVSYARSKGADQAQVASALREQARVSAQLESVEAEWLTLQTELEQLSNERV